MKDYNLFVGCNGCGKTTLYYNISKKTNLGEHINIDEIVVENGGNPDNMGDFFTACYMSVNRIKKAITQGISFNQETCKISPAVFKLISKAKEKGFKLNVFFLSVNSFEIAHNRVIERHNHGGHNVHYDTIKFNFENRFSNLEELFKVADSIYFFDNTNNFNCVAKFTNSKLSVISQNCEWTFNVVNKFNEYQKNCNKEINK